MDTRNRNFILASLIDTSYLLEFRLLSRYARISASELLSYCSLLMSLVCRAWVLIFQEYSHVNMYVSSGSKVGRLLIDIRL